MGNITGKNLKILWGESGNLCAFPECNIEITALSGNNGYTLGEMAHIKGDKEGSCRYDPNQTDVERNSHKNLVLLCPTHHTIIDKPENLSIYTVDFLIRMKEEHLTTVKAKLRADEISDLNELKNKIIPYLTDNHSNWEEYGPLSQKARRNPHNVDLHKIWLHIRLEKILPNNRIMFELLKTNRNLFDNIDQQTISDFITHIESYEKWVVSDNTYESVKSFPQAFNKLIYG